MTFFFQFAASAYTSNAVLVKFQRVAMTGSSTGDAQVLHQVRVSFTAGKSKFYASQAKSKFYTRLELILPLKQ